ncbi:MAG: DUF2501 domain-containing protein [Comamonas sp.]
MTPISSRLPAFPLTSRALRHGLTAGAAALALLCGPAGASGLFDNLKSQAGQLAGSSSQSSAESSAATSSSGGLGGLLGGSGGSGQGALAGLGLPALGGNTLGNAAGVLQYCVQNNYLNAANAQGVKDKLLGKVGLGGGNASQDSGYQQGSQGLLQGNDGSAFNLTQIKGQLKEKACDYVLDNAKNFL